MLRMQYTSKPIGRANEHWKTRRRPYNTCPCTTNQLSASQKSKWPSSPAQKHFRCTMVGPDSSYSALEIHICWKVLNEERMDPPIHTEYFRSGGATTLIFIVDGAKAVSSFPMRSPMPKNIVVPPDRTTLA